MTIDSEQAMKQFGERLGNALQGGEVIELVGDVGAGKTTLTKGIAQGLGIDETVQSPSFTISRVYEARDDLQLVHYDFYRLDQAGVMASDLSETAGAAGTVVVIEWAGIVGDVLPADRLVVQVSSPSESTRTIELTAHGDRATELAEKAVDDSAA